MIVNRFEDHTTGNHQALVGKPSPKFVVAIHKNGFEGQDTKLQKQNYRFSTDTFRAVELQSNAQCKKRHLHDSKQV